MIIKILVAAHKHYWMPEDSVYLPLHVGAEGKDRNGFYPKRVLVDKIYRTKDIIIQRLPVRYKLLNSVIENRYKLWYNTSH